MRDQEKGKMHRLQCSFAICGKRERRKNWVICPDSSTVLRKFLPHKWEVPMPKVPVKEIPYWQELPGSYTVVLILWLGAAERGML